MAEMYKNKKVSVVMPGYNNAEAVANIVTTAKNLPQVDEVILIDNNSRDDTKKLALEAGATVVDEPKQGYGYACQRALREATGDLIILVEPDGTYSLSDIEQLLYYSQDFDLVLGTRTLKDLIWEGANMGFFLKWGNWALGKIIEVLFNGPSLTDVGCTYRLIEKKTFEKIQPYFTVGGMHFSPEMIILAIKHKIRTVQIPVNFKPRVGKLGVSSNKWTTLKIGLSMIKLIFVYKLRSEKS